MKTTVSLTPSVDATLYTGEDVPGGRESPALFIDSYETAVEGLGGRGAPDGVEICGQAAMRKLFALLAEVAESDQT